MLIFNILDLFHNFMLQTYKKIPYRAIKSTIFFFSYLHFIFPHNNR